MTEASTDIQRLLADVTAIAPGLHKAGTFSAVTLAAFVRHATARPVAHSAETGSGASTLLLSHISSSHTVFALDAGTGSISAIQASPLLRSSAVRFVEGPTQLTLPAHSFTDRLQLVLIDGPHGYPFPDLEYYYFYPHLDTGALLVIDDIHIPTITNLLDFLSADEMFELAEVVETTAFFRRTAAPTFAPTGDGWWLQRYNSRAFESVAPVLVASRDAVAIEGTTPFHIDTFGSVTDPADGMRLRLAAGEPIVVSGWALDARNRVSATAVDFVIGGKTYRAATRVPRGDVAQAFGSNGYFRCGFNVSFPAGLVAPGSYAVDVSALVDGGRHSMLVQRMQLDLV